MELRKLPEAHRFRHIGMQVIEVIAVHLAMPTYTNNITNIFFALVQALG
ncbi:hypothetical protein U703_10185 [Rhodobacter capsulatus YW1]|nr:hypothetical protein U703_10185 [Rhodobacter capsulatus YW1]